MGIEKLVEAVKLCGSTPKVNQCKQCAYWAGGDMSKCIPRMTADAATALSMLQAEVEMWKRRCKESVSHASELDIALYDLHAELERVKRDCAVAEKNHMDCVDELDAVRAEKARAIETLSENLRVAYQNRDAAVKDVSTIIGDVEEIRHRYGVDNADADNAFADLCENYCANKGHGCYAEGEKYRCENFKWRGTVKED